MFKKGEYVVYRKDVCKVIDIKTNHLNNCDYYILSPINDYSLKIDVPTDNRCGYLRKIVSREEIGEIIKKIPSIAIIDCDSKQLEFYYKQLIKDGDYDGLIKIIKTTYIRNKERLDNKRKLSEKDNYYFDLAEKYLYNEFGVALGMNYEDTKNYVINEVVKINNQ